MEDFSINPAEDSNPIDDSPLSQPNQQTMRFQYYDQPVLEGLEESPVGQIIISETPTSSVVNSLSIAARNRCGRLIS